MDLFQHLADGLDTFFQPASKGGLARIFEGRVEIKFGNSEALADFVVKLAGDAAALALLHFNETVGERLKFVAGAIAFQFSLFESLGHQIECQRKPAQFIASMTKTCSRREIAHRKARAGVNERFNGTDD